MAIKKTGYDATTIHKAIYAKAGLKVKKVKDIADSEYKLIFPIKEDTDSIVAIVDEVFHSRLP